MQEYKLVGALPNSAPGSTEDHYGYKCEVRQDGIYIKLDDITAKNWAAGGRITKSVSFEVTPEPVIVEDEPTPPIAEVQEAEKPQSMTDVIENGIRKPGRPAKKAE